MRFERSELDANLNLGGETNASPEALAKFDNPNIALETPLDEANRRAQEARQREDAGSSEQIRELDRKIADAEKNNPAAVGTLRAIKDSMTVLRQQKQ